MSRVISGLRWAEIRVSVRHPTFQFSDAWLSLKGTLSLASSQG